MNLSLSRLYPVYRKQPMVASESVEKAQPPTASLQPTQADPILFFTTLSRIIVEVKNGWTWPSYKGNHPLGGTHSLLEWFWEEEYPPKKDCSTALLKKTQDDTSIEAILARSRHKDLIERVWEWKPMGHREREREMGLKANGSLQRWEVFTYSNLSIYINHTIQ